MAIRFCTSAFVVVVVVTVVVETTNQGEQFAADLGLAVPANTVF